MSLPPNASRELELVDAQIHIWWAEADGRQWPPETVGWRHGPAEVTAEDVLAEMDKTGVVGAILVPPSFEGDRNDAVIDAAQRYPDRFRALARVALDRPDRADVLDEICGTPEVVGIRVTFNGRMQTWLSDGTLEWLWPYAADRGLRISMYAPGQLHHVERVAARYPSLKLSIDHLSLSLHVRDGGIAPVVDELCTLARYPNIAVKATCMPSYVSEDFPFPTLAPIVRRVVSAFGPDRVFWGSDLTRLPCPYRECVSFFERALPDLTDDGLALVMGRAVREWFGWESE